MEDEDETQSQPPSPETGSPASPDQNGRITVTVAEAPPSPQQQNTLTLALPIQQPKAATNGSSGGGGGGGGGGGREDCWSEGATSVLIDAWGERYLELSRGNLKQKHWKEVADIVGSREDYSKTPKTDIQCKNRIDTVKKKYKLEKAKIAAGGGPSKWPFFHRLDHLIGPTAKISTPSTQKVPIGIPVGVRSAPPYHHQKHHIQNQQQQQQQQKQKMQFRRRAPADSESSGSEREDSPDSTDSFPPETVKRPRIQRELNSNPVVRSGPVIQRRDVGGGGGGGKGRGWGNSVRELTQAILIFGEAYEQAETSKLQQVVEMEKQRMKFAKDLELQRMQFFMKTQVEISQLKHHRGGRRGGNNHHHTSSNNNNNNNNNNNINNNNNTNNMSNNHSDSTSN